MKNYAEKLQDPRWQKMRLQVMQRDGFRCTSCKSKEKTLHVHHVAYAKGLEPWEYPPDHLVTLCRECHSELENGQHKFMAGLLAVVGMKVDVAVFGELCMKLCLAIDSLDKPNLHPCPPEVLEEAQEILLVARDYSIQEAFN